MLPPINALPMADETMSDEDLARCVLHGNVAAFELIMRRHNQRLFRIARSILGDDAEAEDVVQDSYLRAYEHLNQFAARSRFATWLTKIAVYQASARRRKRRRLQFVGTDLMAEHAMASLANNRDASDESSRRELREILASEVDALPAELRVVVVMRMVEGLSTNESAECLELTPANVKTRLHRARAILQARINQRFGEEATRLYAFDGLRCDRIVQQVMAKIAKM